MGKETFVDHTCSINSQDTDVDINSELISKDEVDLSKTDISEPIENSSLEKETINLEEKGDEYSISQKNNEQDNSDMIGKKFCGVKDNDGSMFSGMETHMKVTCYPNVPGKQMFFLYIYIYTVCPNTYKKLKQIEQTSFKLKCRYRTSCVS
ncbi:hypothetical protein PUN28_007082 [Cardiocondyla obscurior]|uniref:Uncharacterized protein n=1 Tax=Cardiocondyla obscurior TaxID=286306 RepID=A0AAW2G300_9HYME